MLITYTVGGCIQQVGVTYDDSSKALIASAVGNMIACALKQDDKTKKHVAYKKIPIPPDGFCFWHSINAATKLEQYLKVQRTAFGFAKHARRSNTESKHAKELRKKACGNIDPETKYEHGYVGLEQVHDTLKTLKLCFRITVDDEVGKYSNCNIFMDHKKENYIFILKNNICLIYIYI